MAAELIKVYKEQMPSVRLIGKRYTESDRVDGSFGSKWGEWFGNDWFGKLENLGVTGENSDSYIGFMSCSNDVFEYWIGMFFPTGTEPPEGYSFMDIPAGDIATCWLYGNEENGELYGMTPYNMCVDKIVEQGWEILEDYSFERYNCPRFTTPDEKENVILDYCFYLK